MAAGDDPSRDAGRHEPLAEEAARVASLTAIVKAVSAEFENRIERSLGERIDRKLRWMPAVLSAVFALLGLGLGGAIVHTTLTSRIDRYDLKATDTAEKIAQASGEMSGRMESLKAEFEEVRTQVSEAGANLRAGIADAEAARAAMVQARTELDATRQEMAALREELGRLRGAGQLGDFDNLANLNAKLGQLEQTVAGLGERLAAVSTTAGVAPSEAAPPPGVIDRLRIRQEPAEIAAPAGQENRNWVKLTLSLCLGDGPDACAPGPYDFVERVAYRFDERWFANPVLESANPSDDFAVSINVWGSTRIDAEIHLRGPEERVVTRSGRMDTRRTIVF